MVYFEALSAGLPIIGSIFAGSSNEAVEEGVNGFVLDPKDTKDLAEKITRFLAEPGLVEKFSKEFQFTKSRTISLKSVITKCSEIIFTIPISNQK